MKKIVILVLSLSLALCLLASCGCSEHIDADKDGKCDNCSAEVEINCNGEHTDADSDNVCDVCEEILLEIPKETVVSVSFTLMDQDEVPLKGVDVYFYKGSATTPAYTGKSDANGSFTTEILTGLYRVEYNINNSDAYYLANTSSVTIIESSKNVKLSFTNTTPNGSVARPYAPGIETNEYTIAAGESANFIVYRAVNLFAEIQGAGIKVVYGESEYTPDENGKISFALLGEDTNSVERFVVENIGDSAAQVSITINSRPGTQGNPIVVESLETPVTAEGIVKDYMVYYRYIATEAGELSLTLSGESAYASMLNARNSRVTSTEEIAGNVIKLDVEAGDEILINVTVTKEGIQVDVSFTLALAELPEETPAE